MSKTFKAARTADKRPLMPVAWPELAEPPGLPAEDAHIWAIPFDADVEPRAESLGCLCEDERRRAEQFRFDAPKRQFIVARVALRRLLGAYLEIPAADVSITYGRFGKPMLRDSARHLLAFNLAHTSDLVLVAVTRGCDVGVDIERLRTVHHLESIAHRYLHPAEAKDILAAPLDLRHAAFLRCWTAKEAVIKAFGMGLTDSLNAFCVPAANTRGTWIDLPAFGNRDAKRCWLKCLTPRDGAIGAAAFVGERRYVRCFTLKVGDQ